MSKVNKIHKHIFYNIYKYMLYAELIANRSKCCRRKVGSILFDSKGFIASIGYNGLAKGEEQNNCNNPLEHCTSCEHSESNCLIQACFNGKSSYGGTLIVTHKPCNSCLRKLINAGVSYVFYKNDYINPPLNNNLVYNNNIPIQLIKFDYTLSVNKEVFYGSRKILRYLKVSNLGNIQYKGEKLQIINKGYPYFWLKGKVYRVHTLCKSIFFGNNEKQLNHIDGNKLNNNILNLELVDKKLNEFHKNNILGNTAHKNPRNKNKLFIGDYKTVLSKQAIGSYIICNNLNQIQCLLKEQNIKLV